MNKFFKISNFRINGCYEYLDGGSLSEALQDFTGGVCETIKLNKGIIITDLSDWNTLTLNFYSKS